MRYLVLPKDVKVQYLPLDLFPEILSSDPLAKYY